MYPRKATLDSGKLDLGLILARSNGFEPKGRFLHIRTQGDNMCSMFHSVCFLFMRNPVVYRTAKKVVFC